MSTGKLEYVEPDLDVIYGNRPYWQIDAPPDMMIRLKRIFPRAETYRKDFITLDHTTEIARDLEWVRDRFDLEIASSDLLLLEEAAEDHREREETVKAILAGERPATIFREPARPAREYQQIAADLARANGGLLLGDELGLGKSMTCLLALLDPDLLPALIVCPTHLPRQWVAELLKTLPWLKAHILRTGQPYDPRTKREMRGEEPDVLISNYHKLRGWAPHLAGRIRCTIFDEVHELRRADSEKFKAAGRIADGSDCVMAATATPVFNYAGEIHNILSVISPDVLGSREEFAREWGASQHWHDKLRVSDPRALGIYLRDIGVFLRRTRKDVDRELPEVIRIPHTVDADKDVHDRLAAGTYDLAEAILNGTRQEAFQAAGELDWQERQATGIAKAPYVAEFVKMILESERKVVLFGWHREVYRIWLDALAEFNPELYTGSESSNQKDRAVKRFLEVKPDHEAHEECRLLIVSLRSGAGLDGLQEVCKVCVFGELDWSPAMHNQCIGRLHRDGISDQPVAYFLVSELGSDPVIQDVLMAKMMQQEPLRDPDAEVFEVVEDTGSRMRKLAEHVKAIRREAGS